MKDLQILIAILILFTACNSGTTAGNAADSAAKNTLIMSVDESFEPVIAEQLKVFQSSYPEVRVNVQYKPEAECLRDLQKDSTKIVIISRELNRDETKYYDSKISYKPEFAQLAEDAVAVIVNTANPDSAFTINELKQLLTGKSDKKLTVAIDGNTATSTVRYLKDSLLKGGPFGKNITGAKNSEDLINYISTTPGAVGFIGTSWIANPLTGQQEEALQKVKMALIECKNCGKNEYVRPSQQRISFGQYPLVRGLYYVLKENYPGIGSRFVEFLTTERGQLIFRRAFLVPKMSFTRRTTNINESE